jgi:hypothetical protein
MRTYVTVTGAVFALLTLAHIWRGIVEGSQLVTQPWFILVTIAPAVLCLWAVRLLRRSQRS